ncbi:MAG: hypothetical protein JRE40_05000 [Deltaproteobacteria bacterium]|nr:hypothetical protein [Deltaproteobacteria bacterium]
MRIVAGKGIAIDMEHINQNKWTLPFDSSMPLKFPSALSYEFHPWEAKVGRFSDPSIEVRHMVMGAKELRLELSRAWWQWIIPVSHVYIVHNVEWDHTSKAGEPVTFKVVGDVDGGMVGAEMCWRWHVPRWIRKCRRWMFLIAGK